MLRGLRILSYATNLVFLIALITLFFSKSVRVRLTSLFLKDFYDKYSVGFFAQLREALDGKRVVESRTGSETAVPTLRGLVGKALSQLRFPRGR